MNLKLERMFWAFTAVALFAVCVIAAPTRYTELVYKRNLISLSAGENTIQPTDHLSGSIAYNASTSETTATLPAAAAGLEYTVAIWAAGTVNVEAQSGDTVHIGSTSGSGTALTNSGGIVGDYVTLTAVDSTNWKATSYRGNWITSQVESRGTVARKVNVISVDGGNTSLTAANSDSLIASATTVESTATLPTAVAGLIYHFTVVTAGTLTIDVASGDRILDLTNAADNAIQNSGTVGDHLSLVAVDSTNWAAISEVGTWSDID